MKKGKRKKRVITLALVLIITAAVSLFLNEQNDRQKVLQSLLQKEFSISPSSYTTTSTVNKFGYMYTLAFKDEPKITYDFFVKTNKKNEYIVNYYGHNSKTESPLKEQEFMTLNQ